MPLIVDFVLPSRPVSHQTKNAAKLHRWHDYVFGRAMQAWPAKPLLNFPLKFTMVYLTDGPNAGDINNFVKPVQDALCGLIYANDAMILDVSAHMRLLGTQPEMKDFPQNLVKALNYGQTCVYVAVSDSTDLSKELVWT